MSIADIEGIGYCWTCQQFKATWNRRPNATWINTDGTCRLRDEWRTGGHTCSEHELKRRLAMTTSSTEGRIRLEELSAEQSRAALWAADMSRMLNDEEDRRDGMEDMAAWSQRAGFKYVKVVPYAG